MDHRHFGLFFISINGTFFLGGGGLGFFPTFRGDPTTFTRAWGSRKISFQGFRGGGVLPFFPRRKCDFGNALHISIVQPLICIFFKYGHHGFLGR